MNSRSNIDEVLMSAIKQRIDDITKEETEKAIHNINARMVKDTNGILVECMKLLKIDSLDSEIRIRLRNQP